MKVMGCVWHKGTFIPQTNHRIFSMSGAAGAKSIASVIQSEVAKASSKPGQPAGIGKGSTAAIIQSAADKAAAKGPRK